jgi:hypothetical protein
MPERAPSSTMPKPTSRSSNNESRRSIEAEPHCEEGPVGTGPGVFIDTPVPPDPPHIRGIGKGGLRVKVVRRTKPSNSSKPRTVRQMSDEFVPAAPGSWSYAALREANHEAAHALIAVLLGIRVYEARIDTSDVNVLGHIAFDKDTELWKAMCVCVCVTRAVGLRAPMPLVAVGSHESRWGRVQGRGARP